MAHSSSLRRTLRRVLLASAALPPVVVACGGSVADPAKDGGSGSTPQPTTTTTPTPTPTATSTADAGLPDGGEVDASDGGCTTAPVDLPDGDVCTTYRTAPCDLDPDAAVLTQEKCKELCDEDGSTSLFCHAREVDGGRLLTCSTCAIGRRPRGYVPQPAAADDAGALLALITELEEASVSAFLDLAWTLEQLGAPQHLVDGAMSAHDDEVRHTEIMGTLARSYGGDPCSPSVLALSHRPSLERLAVENATEGCVRELFGALTALYQCEHASDPQVRRAMVTIADDEIRHAELSLAIHEWAMGQLDDEAKARVDGELRRAQSQLEEELRAGPSQSVEQVLGLPGAEAAARLLRETEKQVWAA